VAFLFLPATEEGRRRPSHDIGLGRVGLGGRGKIHGPTVHGLHVLVGHFLYLTK
jgi:hypothetical protein